MAYTHTSMGADRSKDNDHQRINQKPKVSFHAILTNSSLFLLRPSFASSSSTVSVFHYSFSRFSRGGLLGLSHFSVSLVFLFSFFFFCLFRYVFILVPPLSLPLSTCSSFHSLSLSKTHFAFDSF